MSFRELIQQELAYQKSCRRKAKRITDKEVDGTLFSKVRPTGRMQFYIREPGTSRFRYVNLQHVEDIRKHLNKRYSEEVLQASDQNILCLEDVLQQYQPIEPADIYERLPKVYRDARDYLMKYDTERAAGKDRLFSASEKEGREQGLIHRTSFGLMVRSKGEALIAEALFSAEIRFSYEKKLLLTNEDGMSIHVHPDFFIDLGRGKTMIWEHKGMLGDPQYAVYDQRKTTLYYLNGIYQPVNLIVTCDGPDGGTDMEAIQRIIRGILLPQRYH